MKRMIAVLLALVMLAALLSACGKAETPAAETAEPIASPTPTPTPIVNPLTGETVSEDISAVRPYAIMINNISVAQPQVGVSNADIIYEVLAEGGITRMGLRLVAL